MPKTIIRPQPGPQTAFLSSPADIVIYGGAAGGGKTWGLLLEPVRHRTNAEFSAVFFRRTYPQVTNPGGMWDESEKLYIPLGAKPVRGALLWRWPSGSVFRFAHLALEANKYDWQGAQVPYLAFDELTHFSEQQFFYLLSRNRTLSGVRPYVRATCNPDADSWVAKFIAWWIDQETGYAIPQRGGAIRYFARDGERIVWGDTPEDVLAASPGLKAALRGREVPIGDLVKSFTFIPATVFDNRVLLASDPGYLANLLALDPVERERLLGGNWKVRAEAGKLFNRAWFKLTDAVPAGGDEVRFWDFAATAKEISGNDPDYTAGVKMRRVDGFYYVTDVVAVQAGPTDVETLFVNTCRQDAALARRTGASYRVRWEVEPGSAGIRETARLVRALAPLDAAGIASTGDKVTRARGLAAQAHAGNVFLLGGEWNEDVLIHLHHQPEWDHDDIMDASAGAFNALAETEAEGGFLF